MQKTIQALTKTNVRKGNHKKSSANHLPRLIAFRLKKRHRMPPAAQHLPMRKAEKRLRKGSARSCPMIGSIPARDVRHLRPGWRTSRATRLRQSESQSQVML